MKSAKDAVDEGDDLIMTELSDPGGFFRSGTIRESVSWRGLGDPHG